VEVSRSPAMLFAAFDSRYRCRPSPCAGLIPGSDPDSLLLASDEGVPWPHYDQATAAWVRTLVGTGEPTPFERTGFRACASSTSSRAAGWVCRGARR
jgi:hypothetical protein